MIVFISGLPGSGKSTAAARVAGQLGWTFVEADDFLTEEMKGYISDGKLLTKEQLDIWILAGVISHIVKVEREGSVVVAGILADPSYVKRLSDATNILFINLKAPYGVLKERVVSRKNFAGLATLDLCWRERNRLAVPGPSIDTTQSIDATAEDILSAIQARGV